MKYTVVLLFVALFASTLVLEPVAAYKKKLLGALALGALLGSKPKILPLPLVLPIPIKHERVKYVPHHTVKYVHVPEPYPVYQHSYGGHGGYESHGYGGHESHGYGGHESHGYGGHESHGYGGGHY